MRDACPPGHAPAPPDWSTAFAAMPLETPPAEGWSRLSAALPPRQRAFTRYAMPAALAASLAILMLWSRQPENAGHTSPPVATQAPSVVPDTSNTPQLSGARTAIAASIAPTEHDALAPPAVASSTDTGKRAQTGTVRTAVRESRAPDHDIAPSEMGRTGSDATQLADAHPAPAQPANNGALETLYAESAQLEALLAQVSDERVASGTAMALSAELHDRVAGLDVALSQPDLDPGERIGLWRERVATLQRLAGVAGTQRWMAANGYRADGEVARVY